MGLSWRNFAILFSAVQLVEDVNHQRELFLVNYTEIGNGHGVAAELQMEHEQFAAESLVSNCIIGARDFKFKPRAPWTAFVPVQIAVYTQKIITRIQDTVDQTENS